MDRLTALGFEDDPILAKELAPYNQRLTPLLFKYQTMGSYYVICHDGDKYLLTVVGGPNYQARMSRLERYSQLNKGKHTLEELIELVE